MSDRNEHRKWLVSRNAWVPVSEWKAFYGSSPDIMKNCEGDEVEKLRQTIYDMDRGESLIYQWSNVPHFYRYRMRHCTIASPDKTQYDGLDQLIDELKPVTEALRVNWEQPWIVRELLRTIADELEKYKKEKGIDRLQL